MKHLYIIATLFLQFLTSETISQTEQNKVFVQSQGLLKTPIPKYIGVIDNTASMPHPSEGMSFLTDSTYPIKSIFDGEVVGKELSVDNFYILKIKFGDYLVSYSNISNPTVDIGAPIKSGQILGNINGEATSKNFEFHISLKKFNKEQSLYKWFNWSHGA